MKIRTDIILLITGVILFVMIVVGLRKVSTMVKSVKAASDNDLPLTQVITREDSSLISPKHIARVRSHQNVNSKVMGPVSFLYVDDTYHLVIFKINTADKGPLKEMLHTTLKSTERTNDETYTVIGFNGFSNFEWRPLPSSQVSNIYFSIDGDSLTNGIINDSIAVYHLLCRNFSTQYEKSGPVEVFMIGGEITPSEILFLKRGKAVYFMLMTTAKSDSSIPQNTLYELVTG